MTTLAEPQAATTWTCRASYCGTELERPSGHAHGFCAPCAVRWYKAGRPDGDPPRPADPHAPRSGSRCTNAEGAANLARFAQLRAGGLTIAQTAAAMGISESAAGHYSNTLIRQERERALATVLDWPGPAPDDPAAVHWWDRAACRRADPDLFHAPEGRSAEDTAAKEIREAKALSLCAVCKVRSQCLADAVERGDEWGVAGGKTGADRTAERRRKQADQRNAKRRVRGRSAVTTGPAGRPRRPSRCGPGSSGTPTPW